MKTRIGHLAAQGVYLGASSWKYPGWRGLLYEEARYVWQGRVSEARFERNCLAEYSEVFKSVCVDAAYYTFPTEKYLLGLASQVPSDFQFGFKVTDEITVRKFPNLPRFGTRAGTMNPHYLDADLFVRSFLAPCEVIRSQVGVMIFEFSRFYPTDYRHGRDFLADLDGFLARLPRGWPYAVELRNRSWLVPDYFACLTRHGVSHVFNSWEAMPSVTEQLAMPGSRTNPELVTARFLLKPGRDYETAVKTFQPYDRVKEENSEARQAGATLIKEGVAAQGKKKTLIFVNNRLEGNSLGTMAAMVAEE
jgi:uncharacterized protein YecE (DUF72 family)